MAADAAHPVGLSRWERQQKQLGGFDMGAASETLSFPGLNLEFTLRREAFSIGPFTVYWYGIIIALAFVAGIAYVLRRTKQFGLDPDRVVDVLLGSIVGGIVGARLYFVAFSWDLYKDDLLSIFKIWEGGIAIYGGLIGAFLVALLMCKLRKVPVRPMFDLAAAGIMLGQAIGRWGNFVNIEAFGGNTTLPWGMTSPSIVRYLTENQAALESIGMTVDPNLPVHPTFLYESLWCLVGFVLLAVYTKHRRFDGEIFLFYTAWYGIERFVVEGLRTDSLMIGRVRVSQILALLLFIASIAIWLTVRSRIRRSNDPEYLKLYVYSEEAQRMFGGKEKTGSDKTAAGEGEFTSDSEATAQKTAEEALDKLETGIQAFEESSSDEDLIQEEQIEETIEEIEQDTADSESDADDK